MGTGAHGRGIRDVSERDPLNCTRDEGGVSVMRCPLSAEARELTAPAENWIAAQVLVAVVLAGFLTIAAAARLMGA